MLTTEPTAAPTAAPTEAPTAEAPQTTAVPEAETESSPLLTVLLSVFGVAALGVVAALAVVLVKRKK